MSAFRPLRERHVRWRSEEGVGLEHLSLRPTETGYLAHGVIIGSRGGSPYGVSYCVVCDTDWRTRELKVDVTDGRRVRVSSDGAGRWRDATGEALPGVEGCVDIDLAGSAFTNTLPIRRLELARGERTDPLKMAYVPFDTFLPRLDWQVYACVEPGALYHYQAADRTFEARLPTDEDGIVLDYPTLFRRVPIPFSEQV